MLDCFNHRFRDFNSGLPVRFASTGQLKLQFEENLLARITCFGIDVEDVLAPDVDVRPGCANLLAGQTGHVVRHFLVHYQVPLT